MAVEIAWMADARQAPRCYRSLFGGGRTVLIAIDGIDGAGKTTLAQGLACVFHKLQPMIEKEPTGASSWGRALRESARRERFDRETELEYFHRDRLHHIEHTIKPALASGRMVILDRYVDSTLAFQCAQPDDAETLYQKFLPEIVIPDITFIIDCDPRIGLARIARSGRRISTFERVETLEKARRIYQSRKGPTYVHLDGERSPEATLQDALGALAQRFEPLRASINVQTCTADRDHGTAFRVS